MKRTVISLALALAGLSFAATNLAAADTKEYQVTGPVLEVTPTYIIVKKGEEKWRLSVDAGTKNAAVKVGDKVTIYYKMVATEVEVKPAAADKKKKS